MTTMTSEREAFEWFLAKQMNDPEPMKDRKGEYRDPETLACWATWQAARAHLAQPAQAVDGRWHRGDCFIEANADHWEAGINEHGVPRNLSTGGVWSHRIACFGATKSDAITLRDTVLAALSGEKAGSVEDEWNSRAAKLLRDLEFSALCGRRCPCCLGWNDQNGETDRQHTKDCELAALIATSSTPGKEG